MGLIEEALREKLFPALFGGEEINANFRKILDHSVKHGGLGILYPRLSEESAYNTSKAASGELVYSLLGSSAFKYVGHRACVRWASLAARIERKHVEMVDLDRQKDLAGGQMRIASIVQQGMGHVLVLYPTALTVRSFSGKNSGIIFALDMS